MRKLREKREKEKIKPKCISAKLSPLVSRQIIIIRIFFFFVFVSRNFRVFRARKLAFGNSLSR